MHTPVAEILTVVAKIACVVVGDKGVEDVAFKGPFMGFPVLASSIKVVT
jgi:hypothetical protein